MYLLGWDGAAVVSSSESMTLDLEDEMEKQRRLDDEFKAKLNREKYVCIFLCDLCMKFFFVFFIRDY